MRYTLLIFLCFLSWIGRAAETEPKTKPDAGGVLIEPSEGEIEPGTTLTFTFPTAMVGADRIDVADQPLPFVSQASDLKASSYGKARPSVSLPFGE